MLKTKKKQLWINAIKHEERAERCTKKKCAKEKKIRIAIF